MYIVLQPFLSWPGIEILNIIQIYVFTSFFRGRNVGSRCISSL